MHVNFRPSRRELVLFGAIWLVFFGVAGGLVVGRGGPWTAGAALWAAAVAVPAIGWAAPGFMRIVYVGMACATFPIGLVVSLLALTGVYYLVFTPIGLALRVCGYDPMARRFDAGAKSYWVPRPSGEKPDRYFRQF
jgi:ABC-type uncharacterized transport system permease subunit